jgi:flagellar motility protein MotE (MotC chaperone)
MNISDLPEQYQDALSGVDSKSSAEQAQVYLQLKADKIADHLKQVAPKVCVERLTNLEMAIVGTVLYKTDETYRYLSDKYNSVTDTH